MTQWLLLAEVEQGFSSLNLVSFLGIFILIGIAWSISSHRSRVNWRLVVTGVVLQFLIAAVLFNSQTWTFPRSHPEVIDLPSLKILAQEREDMAKQVDAYVASVFSSPPTKLTSLTDLDAAVVAKSINEAEVARRISASPLVLPRFANGVLFYGVENFFDAIRKYVEAGTSFVFGLNGLGPDDPKNPLLLLKNFAFGVIPTVIFFGSLMSVLYYVGVMRWVVQGMAWVMQRLMGTSGAESLAAAANVIIGQTEAPLVIKPFVGNMTRSELNCLMVGGFATISGSLMAIFASLGISAGHLLTASIISAPAALVVAKLLQPETEQPLTLGNVQMPRDTEAVNVIDAAAQGASDGMKLAINVIAMLIAFLALIALLDSILYGLGELVERGYNVAVSPVDPVDFNWSIKGIFAVLFYPLAWIMGIAQEDCYTSGEILGTKMVVNEFVAYLDLSGVISAMNTPGSGTEVTLSPRTQVILTYALCGFSNFASIGIQIGGIGALAPERRSDLAQLGLRAMVGGMIACCLTACVAGVLYGIDVTAIFK